MLWFKGTVLVAVDVFAKDEAQASTIVDSLFENMEVAFGKGEKLVMSVMPGTLELAAEVEEETP